MWKSSSTVPRWTLGILALWFLWSSVSIHPDYLAYFNEIAGNRPERFLIDSDLDWGQDWKRLATRLRQLGAQELATDPLIVTYQESVRGLPYLTPIDPLKPSPGWNADSITALKLNRLGLYQNHREITLWTDRIPATERVGKGVLLWYIPAERAQ